MELTFYYNGELKRNSELNISSFEQAFLYGDGVYEPLTIVNREIRFESEHFSRFFKALKMVNINLKINENILKKIIHSLLDLNSLSDATVRLMAIRGESTGYYFEDAQSVPSLLVMTLPLKHFSEKLYFGGVKISTAQLRDISGSTFYSDVRSLGMITRRQSYREAKEKGFFEALMTNIEGYITQCTNSNIFIVRDNTLVTPDLSCGVYPGVTREFVLSASKQMRIDTYEGFILLSNVYQADECFITSTEFGIMPVISCDNKRIGANKPGSITRHLIELFRTQSNN
jgi:branched-chain amino acid aminotransferase